VLEEGRCFDSAADNKIPLSTLFKGSWNVVHASKWRIFSFKVTRRYRQIVILNHRNLASFLADMPDRIPLSSLLLPGSHDTMAFYGWPIAQCQSTSTPLSTQLHNGIRVIDIRLAVVPQPSSLRTTTVDKHKLIAYHGFWPQKTPFTSILNDLFNFLSSPIGSKETIVMSIKQEDYAITPAPLFSKLVRDTIVHGPGGWDESSKIQQAKTDHNNGMWFLENRIPKLGELRGKVVMLSRFGGDGSGWENGLEGLGIHPTTWPDSEKDGFEWELKGTVVKTHDWYAIPSFLSIPEKMERATQNLILPSVVPTTGQPTLAITYFSAALFPLALPPVIAKGFGWPAWGLGVEGVNSKLGAWLLDKLAGPPADAKKGVLVGVADSEKRVTEEPRIRGWTFLDYYSEPEVGKMIVPLLVECNFRGRKEGEEGW